jgi:threonine synthase
MQLLARTEGIFAETAGGTTLAVTKKLIEQGRIPRNEEIVICVTGNGLKTQDCVFDALDEPSTIKPALAEFEELAGLATEAREPALV